MKLPTDDLSFQGLTNQEAQKRLSLYGPNHLLEADQEPFWKNFLEELKEPMVLLLVFTGILYAVWGEAEEAVTIFIIILALNTVEVVNEQRSKRAVDSLRKLAEPNAAVLRDQTWLTIPAVQIVPGEVVLLEAGQRIPADGRLLAQTGLAVDESALTGESEPVEKSARTNPTLPPNLDRVFAGTLAVRGRGIACIEKTGQTTEIGRITSLTRQVREPRTPLQTLMSSLSSTLVWYALGFSGLITLLGVFTGGLSFQQALLTGLSLAFATIPEEMPILITMGLSLGAYRLSGKNVITRRLNAAETLGAVTVIATDKTGTLTENHLELVCCEPQEAQEDLLLAGLYGIDLSTDTDPIEAAFVKAAHQAGIDPHALLQSNPLVAEIPFDHVRQWSAKVVSIGNQPCAILKGSPESILRQCSNQRVGEFERSFTGADRQEMLALTSNLATNGLRVLAFAEHRFSNGAYQPAEITQDLTLIGLVGFQDPLRPETAASLTACREAGIRVLMISGDHPATVQAVARQTGLSDPMDEPSQVVTGTQMVSLSDIELKQLLRQTNLFARVSPEQKLRIVRVLQTLGERVAVTGDGINDAPALAAADIGVAMGQGGTDTAREAADLILGDNRLSTLVNAVSEGRLIFENLRKGVRYYLACKLALLLINLVPALLLYPTPFSPIQIILMEFFMDLMAAAAFVAEGPEENLLKRQPRDTRPPFMDAAMIRSIAAAGVGLAASVITVYLITWIGSQDLIRSQSTAFFAWLVGHVFLAFNLRSERQPIIGAGLSVNRIMVLWGCSVAGFILLSSLLPGIQMLLKTAALEPAEWGLIFVATIIGTFWIEAVKRIHYFRNEEG